MALNASTLNDTILSSLSDAGFVISNTHCKASDFTWAIAEAVVDHITANAVVATTVTGTCPAGGGALTEGAGTGTIS